MKDDDLHAFGAPPSRPPVPPTQSARRRVWPWLLLGAGVLLMLLALAGASAVMALVDSAREGVQITVNGQPWWGPPTERELSIVAVLGVAAALLLLLVVLPVLLILVLLAVALAVGLAMVAVVGAIVLAAGAVLLAVALLLSPLWGAMLLLWWLLRRPRPAAAVPAGVAG